MLLVLLMFVFINLYVEMGKNGFVLCAKYLTHGTKMVLLRTVGVCRDELPLRGLRASSSRPSSYTKVTGIALHLFSCFYSPFFFFVLCYDAAKVRKETLKNQVYTRYIW